MKKLIDEQKLKDEILPPDLATMDRFVKFSDAARILGYASFQSVKKLVKDGILNHYSLPDTSRPRILMSELIALQMTERKADKSKSRKLTKKGNLGRPRKYGKFLSSN